MSELHRDMKKTSARTFLSGAESRRKPELLAGLGVERGFLRTEMSDVQRCLAVVTNASRPLNLPLRKCLVCKLLTIWTDGRAEVSKGQREGEREREREIERERERIASMNAVQSLCGSDARPRIVPFGKLFRLGRRRKEIARTPGCCQT